MEKKLKLVTSDEILEGSLVDELGKTENMVEKLIEYNQVLKDEIDNLCLSIGLSKIDYERYKASGRLELPHTILEERLDRLNTQLKKALADIDLD